MQKIVYDQSSIKISGIIFSFDGNGWNFTSHITNDETITKIFFFCNVINENSKMFSKDFEKCNCVA